MVSQNDGISNLDFTHRAKKSIQQTLKDPYFRDSDYDLIYDLLKNRMRIVPFGDYLKRYIYSKAEMTGDYHEIPTAVFQDIICEEFSDRCTPCSFVPSSLRLRNAAKNWLEQQTVNRNVVLLLGFGLGMSVSDVNTFLTKSLQEYELNAKDPFEVLCWYCYRNNLNYIQFDALWSQYQNNQNPKGDSEAFLERTIFLKKEMTELSNEKELMSFLGSLPVIQNSKRQSVSARQYFDALYMDARKQVAGILTVSEIDTAEKNAVRMEEKNSSNDRLYDYEKLQRVQEEKERFKVYSENDITPTDIENVIMSAVPKDKNGNLVSLRSSSLEKQFLGKRLTRQRLTDIIAGDIPISRYDLLTLLFFVISQSGDDHAKQRYLSFIERANQMLNDCCMGPVYVANPYECFLLMCLLSEDPLGTYADVWELSYSNN